MSHLIEFHAYGIPQPKGSTRAFMPKGARFPVVTSDNPKLKDWQHAIAQAASLKTRGFQFTGPVAVTADFYLPHPKTGKRRQAHTTKPDLDKLSRALCDALTGVVWGDDSQVTALQVSKFYAAPETAPRVIVVVSDSIQEPS